MRRTLRGYEIVEAGSPREALDALKRESSTPSSATTRWMPMPTASICSSYVKLQQPDTMRFLVTANRDLDVVVRAVNEGAVHRYFLKPWNDEKLRSALEILLARRGYRRVSDASRPRARRR